jgi:hypothetical protein
MVDITGAWGSITRPDVFRESREGLSRYGRSSIHEGYAEAFAMWMSDPTHPAVQGYAEAFGWGVDERAAAPDHPNAIPLSDDAYLKLRAYMRVINKMIDEGRLDDRTSLNLLKAALNAFSAGAIETALRNLARLEQRMGDIDY